MMTCANVHLAEQGVRVPTIIMTGHTNSSDIVTFAKRKGIGFMQKPFRPRELVDRIQQTIQQDV